MVQYSVVSRQYNVMSRQYSVVSRQYSDVYLCTCMRVLELYMFP